VKKVILNTAIAVMIGILPVSAGPFLNINTIDSISEFPIIKIDLCAGGINEQGKVELDEQNLLVYEDGYRVNYVRVNSLANTTDFLYLVFSIDSSKSISKQFLQSIKSSARDIISSAGPKDRIAIYRFNDSVKLLNAFIQKKNDLINNINSIRRHGRKTLLYNSIFDSIELLGNIKEKRKAVIVFTDGKDEGSSVDDDDVIKFARDSSIPVYFISTGSSAYRKKLARISKLTGGRLVSSRGGESIGGLYRTIMSVIKSRYLVEYKSQLKADGSTHQAEIRLKYGKFRDRETAAIKTPKTFPGIDFMSERGNILLILIIIFLVLLVITLIFFLKKEKVETEMNTQEKKEFSGESSYIEKLIALEEGERKERNRVLSSIDPEFTYSDAWLIEKDGPETGKKIPIYWSEATIGRSEENSIMVEDEAVSLKHAKIKNINHAYYLFDLVSDNGTFLNDKKLLRPRALYDWDEIKIGRTVFIFRGSNIQH